MKSFYWRTIICLVPVLLSALIVARASVLYRSGEGGFNLGVDLVGGTILVYEIDIDKFPNGQLPENWNAQTMAALLKRRIDPADLYNITIRPVGLTRVEIILPTGGTHQAVAEQRQWDELVKQIREKYEIAEDVALTAEPGRMQELAAEVMKAKPDVTEKDVLAFAEGKYNTGRRRSLTGERVQEIKELISRQGSLEFRILANERDDADALRAAEEEMKQAATNAARKADFDALALQGKPPPPPSPPGPNGFTTPLGQYTYSWVELGRSARKDFRLDNASETSTDAGASFTWKRAADARAKGEAFRIDTSLLWSRAIPEGRRLLDADRDKRYEYFILTRDPESPEKAVTGKYLRSAVADQDRTLKPAVSFRFDQEGGNLFYELTSKNAPEGGEEGRFKRRLAIVLDGQVMSAPTLNDRISTNGQISGSFTAKDIERLVNILRSGALPATLKPLPVSENTIGATLGDETIQAGTWSIALAFAAVPAKR